LVERDLAKVEVTSSSLVTRSKFLIRQVHETPRTRGAFLFVRMVCTQGWRAGELPLAAP
jgi:hypothetical protein